jgi:histone-lysine N-methyltransferase SETMAR
LESGATINPQRYLQVVKKLKQLIRRVRPNRKKEQVLLHDKARRHTSMLTREATATMWWTVLRHPPYSPDLAPCDFHLFGPLTDALRGRLFADIDDLKYKVREELRRFSK